MVDTFVGSQKNGQKTHFFGQNPTFFQFQNLKISKKPKKLTKRPKIFTKNGQKIYINFHYFHMKFDLNRMLKISNHLLLQLPHN